MTESSLAQISNSRLRRTLSLGGVRLLEPIAGTETSAITGVGSTGGKVTGCLVLMFVELFALAVAFDLAFAVAFSFGVFLASSVNCGLFGVLLFKALLDFLIVLDHSLQDFGIHNID